VLVYISIFHTQVYSLRIWCACPKSSLHYCHCDYINSGLHCCHREYGVLKRNGVLQESIRTNKSLIERIIARTLLCKSHEDISKCKESSISDCEHSNPLRLLMLYNQGTMQPLATRSTIYMKQVPKFALPTCWYHTCN